MLLKLRFTPNLTIRTKRTLPKLLLKLQNESFLLGASSSNIPNSKF